MLARTSSSVAGNGVHSSNAMVIVASSWRWISVALSGVRRCGAAVEVRAEGDAVLVQLAQRGQRHDLEAAAVGQDRAGPVHEPVQAAEPLDPVGAGPQHQVVGVAEDRCAAPVARTWSAVIALTVPAVPTGMNTGVAHRAMRGVRACPARAAPSCACERPAEASCPLQQAGVAVAVEAVAGGDRVRVGGPHPLACRRRRRPA